MYLRIPERSGSLENLTFRLCCNRRKNYFPAAFFFSSWMNMSIGMLVHEASILVVILNGMRLLRYRLRG